MRMELLAHLQHLRCLFCSLDDLDLYGSFIVQDCDRYLSNLTQTTSLYVPIQNWKKLILSPIRISYKEENKANTSVVYPWKMMEFVV